MVEETAGKAPTANTVGTLFIRGQRLHTIADARFGQPDGNTLITPRFSKNPR